MKNTLILTLLLLSFFVITFATEFGIVCKPGTLLVPQATISLKCLDTISERCFFNLDLPKGNYFYRSDTDDTCTIIVEDTSIVSLNNNVIIIK